MLSTLFVSDSFRINVGIGLILCNNHHSSKSLVNFLYEITYSELSCGLTFYSSEIIHKMTCVSFLK
jgi:hypothetical protein